MVKKASKDYREKSVFYCECGGCRDCGSDEPAFAHPYTCPACGARLKGEPDDVESRTVVACSECPAEWVVISDFPLILAKL